MDMAKACNTNDVRADVVELKELESAKSLKRICKDWKAVTGASHRREPTKQPAVSAPGAVRAAAAALDRMLTASSALYIDNDR